MQFFLTHHNSNSLCLVECKPFLLWVDQCLYLFISSFKPSFILYNVIFLKNYLSENLCYFIFVWESKLYSSLKLSLQILVIDLCPKTTSFYQEGIGKSDINKIILEIHVPL
jgi:hypothetical protein